MRRTRTRRQLALGLIMSVLSVGLVVGAKAAVAGSGPLPFTVANNSGRSDATYIYVMARGGSSSQQGYVDGGGTWHAFNLPASVPSGTPNPAAPDVSIPGPGNGAQTAIALPDGLAGGRMYISFGAKLSFYLTPGGLVEPAPWNPNDANTNVLYDWAEFSRVNGAIFINTTQVDLFSIPMSVSVTGTNGASETQGQVNSGGRDGVFAAFQALGGDWAKLIYNRPSDGLPLRVYAPTHGINYSPSPLFSSTYLDPYIAGVWSYYASHNLTLDLAQGTYTGHVNGNTLSFTASNGSVVANLDRPTTDDVFGCKGAIQPQGQPDESLALQLGAQICAELHRGTLSTPTRTAYDHQPVLDASLFYKAPQTDLYSKIIHDSMVNGKAYGFAYDDVNDFSPSINQPNPASATLTLTPFAGGSTGSTGGSGGTVSGNVLTGPSSKCVDVSGDDNGGNGSAVQMWDCLSGAVDQHWTAVSGALRTLNRCLDVTGNGTGNGAQLELWDCTGGGAQQWVPQADGSLKNPQSGRCMDSPGGSTANGARLQIWDCNGSAAQKFSIVGGTGAAGSTSTSTGTGTSTGGTATATIQAEAFSAQSGTQTEGTSDTGGGQDVGYAGNGDWLQFSNVDFGTAGLHTFNARVASGAPDGVSGLVEVHLDSLSNPAIGSFSIGSTGGWQTWRTVPAAISTTTGSHTVFVKFVTGSGQDFVNTNWISFS